MTDSHGNTSFTYVTGGTLPPNAASYIERKADYELLAALLEGEFCYLLDTRQMGKSSLMVRTGSKLRERDVDTVVLDLSAIGQNVTVDRWYAGLLVRLGDQLQIEDELVTYWRDRQEPSGVQRFIEGIRKALVCLDRPLVIFNSRLSPFNIGKRIVLKDFTAAEAAPLAQGLAGGRPSLERVLYWTGGHPYLTQRLCRAVAEAVPNTEHLNTEHRPPTLVDRLCAELFLTHRARETDDNLAFVRNRLLKSEVDLAALLELYGRICAWKRVPDDETHPLCSVVKLSGIVRSEEVIGIVGERLKPEVQAQIPGEAVLSGELSNGGRL